MNGAALRWVVVFWLGVMAAGAGAAESDWAEFAAERGRKNPPGPQATPPTGGKASGSSPQAASPGAPSGVGKASPAGSKAAAQAGLEQTLVEMNAQLEAARARVEELPIQPVPQAIMRKILEAFPGKLSGYYQNRTYRDDFFRGEGAGDLAKMSAEQAYFGQANLAMIGAVYGVDEVRGSVQPLRSRYIREFTGSDRTLTEAELFAVIERQVDMGVSQLIEDLVDQKGREKSPDPDMTKVPEILREADAAVARARSELDPAKVQPLPSDAFFREPSEEDYSLVEGLFLDEEARRDFVMNRVTKLVIDSKNPADMHLHVCVALFMGIYFGDTSGQEQMSSRMKEYFRKYYGEGAASNPKVFALIQMQLERANKVWCALPPQTRDKLKPFSKLNIIAAPVPDRVQKLEGKLNTAELSLRYRDLPPLKIPENLSDRDLMSVRMAVAAYMNKDYRAKVRYALLVASEGEDFDDALYFAVSNLTLIRIVFGLPTAVSYREAKRRYIERYVRNWDPDPSDVEVFVLIRKQLEIARERVQDGTATPAEVAIFQPL